jgi:hypothetical protein
MKFIADTIEQPAAGLPLIHGRGVAGIKAAAVSRIRLDELGEGDMLLIQTANSVYSFILTDLGQHGGLLMGGRLGDASATAWLVGAQEQANDDGDVQESYLGDGLHAVFLVADGSDSRRLVTSAIKRLTYLKVPVTSSGEAELYCRPL